MEKIYCIELIRKWTNLSEVKRATIVFLICTVVQKMITVVSTPIFTRLMSTEEYGQFTVYQSWLLLFSIITTFRLDYDVFNKGMTNYKDKNSYVSTMQLLTTFFTVCVLCLYGVFSRYLNDLIELPTIVIIAIFIELLFMSPVSFWGLKERYEFKYQSYAIIVILMSLLNIVIGIIAVCLSNEKGTARILSCVSIQVIFGVVIFWKNLKKANRKFVKEYASFALLFNIPLIPHYFSSYILNSLDKLMIQKMIGVSEAGIYGVVYSAGLAMTMVSTAICNSLIPWQYKKLKERNFDSIKNSINIMMFALMVVLTIFIFLAPEIMMIFASKEYYQGVYIIPSVSSSILFIFIYNLVCNAEFYYDRNRFTMIITGISAILNIVLNYIFIRIFGYMVAGYTTLICYILVANLHVLYANRIVKKIEGVILYDFKTVLIFTVIMVFLSFASTILYSYTKLRYAVIVVLLLLALLFKKRIIGAIKGYK